MVIGLLGLQGAFLDHIRHIEALGEEYRIVRDKKGLQTIDRLIIPGGESTVMTKFLHAYEMADPLKELIEQGMPAWGICAGSILMAETVDGEPGVLKVLPAKVARNAYGRQCDSRETSLDVPLLKRKKFRAMFIRAPKIVSLDEGVHVYAEWRSDPVFVRKDNVMATTFHPELTEDGVFHDFFFRL